MNKQLELLALYNAISTIRSRMETCRMNYHKSGIMVNADDRWALAYQWLDAKHTILESRLYEILRPSWHRETRCRNCGYLADHDNEACPYKRIRPTWLFKVYYDFEYSIVVALGERQ